MLGWPWNTLGRKNAAGRTFSQEQAMVICFLDRAKEADPDAFPPGSIVRYWPFVDERQRKAFEAATNSPV